MATQQPHRRKRWPDDYQSDGDNDKGVRCPKCHCQDTRVYYTRKTYGERTHRRRICRHCEHMFSTFESTK